MTATRTRHATKTNAPLYLAFELGWNEWKLAFATGPADNPRLRNIGARNTSALLQEIAKAKKRFGLAEDAPVFSCYEAGRDGFWLHRYLEAQNITNQVVDSSSIEVKRRGLCLATRQKVTSSVESADAVRKPSEENMTLNGLVTNRIFGWKDYCCSASQKCVRDLDHFAARALPSRYAASMRSSSAAASTSPSGFRFTCREETAEHMIIARRNPEAIAVVE